MTQGYINNPIPISVNLLPSRGGLTTVGYRLLDTNLSEVRPRTTVGVQEIVVSGSHTGVYTAVITLSTGFVGFVLWDSGQDPNAPVATRLRTAREELVVLSPIDVGDIGATLVDLQTAVGVLYEENTMKIPNSGTPNALRIVRKRPHDADWSQPLSDVTIPIDQRPGHLRFGGPPIV